MAITHLTDLDLIKRTLVDWLKTYGSLNDVYFKNQKAERASKPYGTILIVTGAKRFGIDEERHEFVADAIDRTTLGLREMRVQLDVYTHPAKAEGEKEAFELLENALSVLETQTVKDLFKSAKLAFVDHTPVKSIDEQLGDRWERRAMSELKLYYQSEIKDTGGNWIETVETPTESNTNLTVNI